MIRNIQTARIDWQGITIEIRYEANWLNSRFYATAHLQVQSIAPKRAPLPFTETGYRSHFIPADDVMNEGGPLAYVRMWLDHEAQNPAWIAQQDAAKQLTLF